jgi:hypothetical protein
MMQKQRQQQLPNNQMSFIDFLAEMTMSGGGRRMSSSRQQQFINNNNNVENNNKSKSPVTIESEITPSTTQSMPQSSSVSGVAIIKIVHSVSSITTTGRPTSNNSTSPTTVA